MKRNYRMIAALLSVCVCLTPAPMYAAAQTSSLPEIVAAADAERSDYRIRTLDFPAIDRSDLLTSYVYKMADDRYALKDWGVIHAEDYINTPSSRGPYYAATAIVNRKGEFITPWQPTMSGCEVTFEDGVYSIVYTKGLRAGYWKENMPKDVSEYYDAEGHVLFEHEPFAAAGPMQDGVAWVAYPADNCDYPQVQFIDKTGCMIADLSGIQFSYIHEFSEGLANYCYLDADGNKHYGYLDKTGKTVLETDNFCGDFHNGLAWVQIDGKYGFMDTSGTLIIPAEYNALGDRNGFTAESVLVKKGDYWALMDTTGKFLTDFVYTMSPRPIPEMLYPEGYVHDAGEYVFRDGYTAVYRNEKYCLLDTKGNERITGVETSLYCYGNGLFGVGKEWYNSGGVYNIIDINGNTVVSQDLGSFVYLGNGVFWIVRDGDYYYIEIEDAATASIIPGDVNGDGITDIMDIITLNKHLLGSKELDAAAQKAADMNGDNKVDSSDFLEVLKAMLGIKSE